MLCVGSVRVELDQGDDMITLRTSMTALVFALALFGLVLGVQP